MSSTSAVNSLLSSSDNSNAQDISSILAAVAGVSTPGIDVTAAVSSAVYALRAPERVWQAEQTTLSSQTSALQSIQAAGAAVQTDLQSLNSLNGPLSARDVYSSNSNAVVASAASGTVTGTHVINVASLATTSSSYSSEQSSATAALPTASFAITPASGAAVTINTGTGGDATLNDVVTDINGQNLGLTASIVTDANGSRLSLVANTSGSAASFTVAANDPTTGLQFTSASPGANASLTVDGVPISSATNTVSGAIPGVTLDLLSPTTAGTPVDLSVASDASSIASTLNQFVSDYNSAVSLVNQQFTYNSSTSSQGVLGSDSTVRSLQETLQSIASYTTGSTSGAVNSLSDLGISVGTDGTLSVDTTTLDSVLSYSPDDVQTFLQGTSLNGFANTANNQIDAYTDPSEGAFTVDLSSISSQNTDLTNEINDFETNYITPQQTALTADYTSAEEALQSLPTQETQLQDELGYNTKSS